MDKFIKNVDPENVFIMAKQVGYLPGQIVSKTLAQNDAVSLTVFAFDKGEEISSHESTGDAMVTVLDGTGELTVNGQKYTVHAGESIVMPAQKPHAVYAPEPFKMFLTVVFPRWVHCLGCPASQMESLEEACDVHGIDSDIIIEQINEHLAARQ